MSVNKVILIGNVGKDPEVRYLDNNNRVANFSLATTERGYTLQNGTQIPDKTEWHNIVVWSRLAETAEKWVKKGSQLYIEGRIRTRSYDDKNGIKRYVTEIYADSFQFLGSRRDDTSASPMQESPNVVAAQPAAQPVIKSEPFESPNVANNAPVDEDLPF